ncbi:MAG TPA: hypothetical protein VNI52_08355 [Sphingobacteriaceae bacterium]|nr:hypothetical protein [Sphingobacteriaceae bacterium]
MILVADSGSSKTDWISSLPVGGKFEFATNGMNPFFLSEKEIVKILLNNAEVQKISLDVREIYFFGAGCSNPDRREAVSNALSQVFKNAFVNVESDLLGSAYATCGNNQGMSCILGTGSNITFYDGHKVIDGMHGLGYILGDEAAGTYFGKKLITSYLYGTMPAELQKNFNETYHINKEIVIQNLYQKPSPNFYLASFSKFMSANKEHTFIIDLLQRGFKEFIKDIQSYPDHKKYNCHFVGSIAYTFQDILRTVCNEHSITIGKILKKPIDELFNFIILRENRIAQES